MKIRIFWGVLTPKVLAWHPPWEKSKFRFDTQLQTWVILAPFIKQLGIYCIFPTAMFWHDEFFKRFFCCWANVIQSILFAQKVTYKMNWIYTRRYAKTLWKASKNANSRQKYIKRKRCNNFPTVGRTESGFLMCRDKYQTKIFLSLKECSRLMLMREFLTGHVKTFNGMI